MSAGSPLHAWGGYEASFNLAACVSTLIICLFAKVGSPVVFSSSLMGVVFMAPVIILMARFSALEFFSAVASEAVDVAAIPFSRTSRTLPT